MIHQVIQTVYSTLGLTFSISVFQFQVLIFQAQKRIKKDETRFSRLINLFFMIFWNKEGDVKALILLSKILFQRRDPGDNIASLVIFKLNLDSSKLYILFLVK